MKLLVYEHDDDAAPDLDVLAWLSPENTIILEQGGERVVIPFEYFGEFVDALEMLYAS